jgi:hypothetical protein
MRHVFFVFAGQSSATPDILPWFTGIALRAASDGVLLCHFLDKRLLRSEHISRRRWPGNGGIVPKLRKGFRVLTFMASK